MLFRSFPSHDKACTGAKMRIIAGPGVGETPKFITKIGRNVSEKFPSDYYHENGIYIPRLYGKPWYEWNKMGLHSVKAIEEYLAEQRIDTIGQNGNDGLHYQQTSCLACPDQRKDDEG